MVKQFRSPVLRRTGRTRSVSTSLDTNGGWSVMARDRVGAKRILCHAGSLHLCDRVLRILCACTSSRKPLQTFKLPRTYTKKRWSFKRVSPFLERTTAGKLISILYRSPVGTLFLLRWYDSVKNKYKHLASRLMERILRDELRRIDSLLEITTKEHGYLTTFANFI